ncbi:MAG TPA: DUF899 family protein [Acetobacteraceae bacterium]|nr:DUF899 family protein [Acetobacteraceae bacterium]
MPAMTYRDTATKLADWRAQIAVLRRKMREAQTSIEPEPVHDYEFAIPEGAMRLSQLFATKRDLFVIHNMGRSCPHCTLWADGFNGIYPHIADRAAFVIASPDPPEVQRSFAAGRGWRMPMVSHQVSSFAVDMGYRSAQGRWLPGVSVFRRGADRILRVADAGFEPNDDFCALWHLFDLLPEGAAGWQAKFSYG